jgi:hypothetical protein
MNTRCALVLCALALVAAAPAAEAASVLVTNASSGWTVSRYTSVATSGSYDAVAYTLDATTDHRNVVEVNPTHPLWTAQNDGRLAGVNSKWISSNVGSGVGSTDPMYTKYIYYGSFSVASASSLSLTFAADNFVDVLTLSTGPNGTGAILDLWTNPTLPLGDLSTNGKVWGFRLGNLQNRLVNGSGTVYVTAVTYNFDTAYNVPFNPGPNGFIMAVDATPVPVPVPAAAWGGLSLLGSLGLARQLRRR